MPSTSNSSPWKPTSPFSVASSYVPSVGETSAKAFRRTVPSGSGYGFRKTWTVDVVLGTWKCVPPISYPLDATVTRYLQGLIGWATVGQLVGRPVTPIAPKTPPTGRAVPVLQSTCVPSLSAGLAVAYLIDGQ